MKPFKSNYLLVIIIQSIALVSTFFACNPKKTDETVVTKSGDYSVYLNSDFHIQKMKQYDHQIDFWYSKYKQDDRGFIYLTKLAVLYIKKFRADGNIKHVFTSDSLYNVVLQITHGKNKVSAYQGLSQNAILKHQFKRALSFADSALQNGANSMPDLLLKFDALMEVGDTVFSHQLMTANPARKDFDFLTRKSKYLDQIGDLDSAILVMELAASQMESSGNTEMICWSLSNLGDMYMHSGRVQESYDSYLKVLSLDSAYQYALKGIAWLAYSNDKNAKEAIHILNFLSEVNQLPDVYLTLAEITTYIGDHKLSKKYHEKFYSLSSNDLYSGMYNKYKILLNVEEFGNFEVALDLCNKELYNRKTPEVYDLLAWTYFNMAAYDKAYEISERKVMNQSFEPELMFHTGKILEKKNLMNQAELYLQEVLESKIEIGPVLYDEVLHAIH